MSDVGGLRIIRSGQLTPTANMALDAAMMKAGADPALRLYGWEPGAISLGYFQPHQPFAASPDPIVRRMTGGGAIFHGDELTFAITGPVSLLPGSVAQSYSKLHEHIGAGLHEFGVPNRQVPADEPGRCRSTHAGSSWCFATAGPNDLIATESNRKLLGSAQRRCTKSSRILHHGSLPLRTPRQTPFAAAIADHFPTRTTEQLREQVELLLIAAIGTALGLSPIDGALTDAELELQVVESERHASPEWLERR